VKVLKLQRNETKVKLVMDMLGPKSDVYSK